MFILAFGLSQILCQQSPEGIPSPVEGSPADRGRIPAPNGGGRLAVELGSVGTFGLNNFLSSLYICQTNQLGGPLQHSIQRLNF